MRKPDALSLVRPVHALACFAAGALLLAATARAHNPELSKPYTYTVGDAIATRTQGIFRIVAGLEAYTLVYYDREKGDVVAEIIGDTDDVAGAERELQAFVRAIQDGVVPFARKQHHLDLKDNDVTLVYYCTGDGDELVEVVRRENGAFIMPKPEEGEDERE
ncbi:MAG TPA: hypothetical protein VID50_08910 [Candidatus Eisenbacteria bacterium]|jgi:hypothetical protein